MTIKTETVETTTTTTEEKVKRFTLPKKVSDSNADAKYIADHAVLSETAASTNLTMSEKDLDGFFELKGISRETVHNVIDRYNDFTRAGHVVAGHLTEDLVKKAKKDGTDPKGVVSKVSARSKLLQPSVSVAAQRRTNNPQDPANPIIRYGAPTVDLKLQSSIDQGMKDEIAAAIQKAMG